MIAGGNTTLVVADVERSVRFYVETLGFKLRVRESAFAEVDGGDGLVLGLHPQGAHTAKPGAHGAISVGLAVNQPIADVVEVLSNRGVSFRAGEAGVVRDGGAVWLAFFADPDGNALYLFEPKVRTTSG